MIRAIKNILGIKEPIFYKVDVNIVPELDGDYNVYLSLKGEVVEQEDGLEHTTYFSDEIEADTLDEFNGIKDQYAYECLDYVGAFCE